MNRTLFFVLGFLTAALIGAVWFTLRDDIGGVVLTEPASFAEKLTAWRVTLDSGTGRIALGHDGGSVSPVWKLEPGWFVLVENDERAWWFNGTDSLVVVTFAAPNRLETFGADNAPALPPAKLLSEIGARRYAQIAAASAESRRRLGLTP